MQIVLQRLQRADNMIGRTFHLFQRSNLRICQHYIIRFGGRELPYNITNSLDIFTGIQTGTGRYHECQYHPGNSAMYARLQEEVPNYYTEEQKENLLRHPQLAHIIKEYIQDSRYNQVSVCHVSTIKQCNHQYSPDVINHSKSSQEYLQAQRNTLAQQTEHPQRKRNIRGHRNGHSPGFRSTGNNQ